ncbi:MAG: beta-propeller domain-containing protein [Planctomycetales bacterium]|nr:beta-propeller domain-containing protein [Planctomycetales bacterium]
MPRTFFFSKDAICRRFRSGAMTAEVLEERQLLTSMLVEDAFSLLQNSQQISLDLLANDIFEADYQGERKITSVSFGSEGGQIQIAEDGTSVRYLPPPDFAGQESFTYFVDNQLNAAAVIRITSPLKSDEIEINPDGQPHVLDVLGNDVFPADYGGEGKITLVSVTQRDSAVAISADAKSVIYTPSKLADPGRDYFTYVVDNRFSTTVQIQLASAVNNDTYTLRQGVSVETYAVLDNDPFWEGYVGERKITAVSPSSSNSLIEISDNGQSLRYQPAKGYTGSDVYHYVVDDVYEASVYFRVQRRTQNDFLSYLDTNSQGYPIAVLDNDFSVQRVTNVSAESRQGGRIQISDDGQSVLYTAPHDYTGDDYFSYTADNQFTASVRVNVSRPVRPDSHSVIQGIPMMLPVLENDFQGNGYAGGKQITSVSPGDIGSEITIIDNQIRYLPDENTVGNDRFQYEIDDSLAANVNVRILPLAEDDLFYFCNNGHTVTHTLDVLANDRLDQGYQGSGRITSFATDNNWQATIVNQESIQVTPLGESGRITYTIDDQYSADATIRHIGHLQSDGFRIGQNNPMLTLDVMANDFRRTENTFPRGPRCLSRDYVGNRIITAVSSSEHGGQVEISEDGQSIRYQPATDFVGVDQFSYEVDGQMAANVSVRVVRRVLDDVVSVRSGQTDELAVLFNDNFGDGYSGPQRITHVSDSTIGGTVSIAADGRSIVYQAPTDFQGSEVLEYTVDGMLKGRITVQVDAEASEQFARFTSSDQFFEHVTANAASDYHAWFGSRYPMSNPRENASSGGGTAGPPRESSDTNVQVAGIDEADLVEFDANYMYSIHGSDVVIMSAWPGESLAEIARIAVQGKPVGQYLNETNHRLTVISTSLKFVPDWDGEPERFDALGWWLFPDGEWQYSTLITVFDVRHANNPSLVHQTVLGGVYLDSRAVGDHVFVATSFDSTAPRPRVLEYLDEGSPATPDDDQIRKRYETLDEYRERINNDRSLVMDRALPHYTTRAANGDIVRSGWLAVPQQIYLASDDDSRQLITLTSVNVVNQEPTLTSTSTVLASSSNVVYASLTGFYLFDPDYDDQAGRVTRIRKFDWDSSTGQVRFVANDFIPGQMVDQFSVDEYDGYLRIVVTVDNRQSGNWSGRRENVLFVLRQDNGIFEYFGSMQNLAIEQTVTSVRFFGDRVFLATARRSDPLFAVDLSDPTQPIAVGALALPGITDYLQFVGADRLLAVGRNVALGVTGPAMISLFDVSSLHQPQLVDQFTFERFSRSEAAVDHHALGYFASHGLLALPSARAFRQRTDQDGDGFFESYQTVTEHDLLVFAIDAMVDGPDDGAIQLVGSLEHQSPVRRSGYVGDYLYSVADDSVLAMHVSEPHIVVGRADSLVHDPGRLEFVNPVWPVPSATQDAMDAARTDLAQRANVAVEAVLLVSFESSQAHGDLIVLQVAGTKFLYSMAADTPALVEVNFQFDTIHDWHNASLPADVNGDGQVTPNDAVLLIAELENHGARALLPTPVHNVIRVGRFDFDVNRDGQLTSADVLWVTNLLSGHEPLKLPFVQNPDAAEQKQVDQVFQQVGQAMGDANLDGRFDSADLVAIFQAGEFEDGTGSNSLWSEGDWNGDLEFTTADLVLAFQQTSYDASAVSQRKSSLKIVRGI